MKTLALNSTAEDEHAARELGLFIIWEKAKPQQDRILSDLERRFDLLRVYEVHWTPSLVMENFQRFYADIDLRGVYHALTKGAGPFLLVTLIDPHPSFEPRDTTRGRRTINARLLDAKTQYRQWTGRFQVHSSETAWETNRDLSMLLGVGAKNYLKSTQGRWDRRIEKLEQDLVGARGWRSLSELFWALNRSVNYVAVDNEPPLSETQPGSSQQDIDLFTDQYWAVHALSNTRQHPPTAPNGGRFPIDIDGARFRIGIRFVGDGYYDPQLEEDILRSRILDKRGVYRPSDRDRFQALAYRSLVHKAAPGSEDKDRLIAMASKLQLNGWTRDALNDPRQAKALLDRLLQECGHSYIEPRDATLFYNKAFLQGQRSPLRRLATEFRRQLALAAQKLALPLLASLWRGRDQLIWRFPVLRTVKIWLRNLM